MGMDIRTGEMQMRPRKIFTTAIKHMCGTPTELVKECDSLRAHMSRKAIRS